MSTAEGLLRPPPESARLATSAGRSCRPPIHCSPAIPGSPCETSRRPSSCCCWSAPTGCSTSRAAAVRLSSTARRWSRPDSASAPRPPAPGPRPCLLPEPGGPGRRLTGARAPPGLRGPTGPIGAAGRPRRAAPHHPPRPNGTSWLFGAAGTATTFRSSESMTAGRGWSPGGRARAWRGSHPLPESRVGYFVTSGVPSFATADRLPPTYSPLVSPGSPRDQIGGPRRADCPLGVVVAFSGDGAWVLLVGPHAEGDDAADVYRMLYELAGIPRPAQPRTKPPCCDDDQQPPRLDEAAINDLGGELAHYADSRAAQVRRRRGEWPVMSFPSLSAGAGRHR